MWYLSTYLLATYLLTHSPTYSRTHLLTTRRHDQGQGGSRQIQGQPGRGERARRLKILHDAIVGGGRVLAQCVRPCARTRVGQSACLCVGTQSANFLIFRDLSPSFLPSLGRNLSHAKTSENEGVMFYASGSALTMIA